MATQRSLEQSPAEEQLVAEIRSLKMLGPIDHWREQESHAEHLLQLWLNIESCEVDEASNELCELDRLGHWLWDQLDPPSEWQFDLPVESKPFVIDIDRWVSDVTDVLIEGWQQFERFTFRCEEDSDSETDGDLAIRASSLCMQYDFLDPVTKQNRKYEVARLWSELEHHIDPDGVIQESREGALRKKKAEELRREGKHHDATLWLLPKDQWERPKKCCKEEWANIIKPFNRRDIDEPLTEFLALVELARFGKVPSSGATAEEALKAHKEDPHTKIRQMIDAGAGASEIQELINQQPRACNQAGLAKFAEQCRMEQERCQDLADALEDLLLRGAPPAIDIANYVPGDWLPMFRVLRDGLKFSDEAIVMTMMAGVAAMLPPDVRISGWSMEEIPTVWLFHIGTSGTAKSVLLRTLINQPMAKPISNIDAWNERELQRRKAATEEGEAVPPYRKRNLIYTAPTTQGIRADLAVHGEEVPGLLVRDELNGWLKQMADDGGAGVGDIEFWLSSYDGAYSNDVFADANKSREVRCGKLGVIGGIQPKVFLEQLGTGNANGFNSRPLFVHLPRVKRVLIQPDGETEKLKDRLGELYLGALEDSNRRYVLSKEAEAMFQGLFDQLEDLSLQANSEEVEALWAKGPGQVLRVAAAVHFMQVATGMQELEQQGWMKSKATVVVSTRSVQLAAKLVMVGKTRAVELHERAANPILERADKLLEAAKKRQGKAQGKGVRLSEIRKGWSSRDRPTLLELKQMSALLASRGLVQLLDGEKSIRVVR